MNTSIDFLELLYKLKKKEKKEILILLPENTKELDIFCAGFSLKIILENMQENFQVSILGEEWYNRCFSKQGFSFLQNQELNTKTLSNYLKEGNSFDLLITLTKNNLVVLENATFSHDFSILETNKIIFCSEVEDASICGIVFAFFKRFLIKEDSASTGILNSSNSTSLGLIFSKNYQHFFFSDFKVPEEVYLLLYLGILISFKRFLPNLVHISAETLLTISQLKKGREQEIDSLIKLHTWKVL